MNLRYLLTLLVIFSLSFELIAQNTEVEQETSPLSISGSVDAYFRSNLNAKNSGDFAQAPATSFGNLPGFSLGMINLITSYEGEKAGFVADLVFGPRGSDAVFASPHHDPFRGTAQMVNQLYAYWNVTDKLTLTMGNFNTFLGYEVISPVANFNYSTSYMFSYGPFSHTGLKADYIVSDDFTIMASVMNPTDFTEFNPFGSYTAGLQLGFFGSAYLNFLYGDQDGKLKEKFPLTLGDESAGSLFQVDLTTGFDITDKFYLGLNTTYNTTSPGQHFDETGISDIEGDDAGFYGAATYLQLSPTDKFAIGTRLEYFKVFNYGLDGVVGLDDEGNGSVFTATLSGRTSIGNLILIPELRLDSSSEETFIDNNLEPSKGLASFIMAAVYSF